MAEEAQTGHLMALALKRAGVSHVFTLNGAHIWSLYTGALEQDIRLVDTRHEQAAAFAAEGWAKITREVGVAAVTAGPGVTNAVSAIAGAHQNDSPLLVLGGRSPAARWGKGALQEMEHVPIVKTITKSAQTIERAEDAYRATAEAVRLALSERTGPAFLDVPWDVFIASDEAPEATEHLVPDRGAPPDPDQVAAIAGLLAEAERPALVAGGGVWWAHAEAELVRLAEAAHLPVVLNGLARGVLPPDHPLFATRARSTALGQADLVLCVGVPLDFRLNWGMHPVMLDEAKIVYVDVDDFRKHRPPAAAIYGDVKQALADLAEAARDTPARPQWLELVAGKERAARERDLGLAAADGSPVHPARVIVEVERFLDEDAVIVGDGGDFVSFAGKLIHRRRPGLWMDPGPFGCLGSGPAYALAAKLAHPRRQVLLLAGDGAFGFSAMEFDTLVRHKVPVVCVVGNNGIWALEKHPMQNLLGMSIVSDLGQGTRYDKVVEALGGHGELVERPEQIAPALKRAFDSGLPACVNVLCDPAAEYPRSTYGV